MLQERNHTGMETSGKPFLALQRKESQQHMCIKCMRSLIDTLCNRRHALTSCAAKATTAAHIRGLHAKQAMDASARQHYKKKDIREASLEGCSAKCSNCGRYLLECDREGPPASCFIAVAT